MGRELQKKKNRSSLHKIKHKPKSKKLNIRGNPIVARNWFVPFLSPFPSLLPSKLPKPLNPDLPYPRKLIPSTTNRNKHETLTQNYRRLGLVSKLNPRAGGVEPLNSSSAILPPGPKERDSLAIREKDADILVPGTARIVRDEKGEVVRVLYHDREDEGKGEKKRKEVEWRGRKLVDELGEDDEEGTQHEIFTGGKDDGDGSGNGVGDGNGVVRQLAMAARQGERKKGGGRKQSRREEEWVERLVGRYGDDVGRMARDRKLNPMQQSPADIARRVRIWREGRRKGDGNEVGDDGGGGLEMD